MIPLTPIVDNTVDIAATDGATVGEYVATDAIQLAGTVILSSVTNTAASFSVRVELLDDTGTPVFQGGLAWTEIKPVATETSVVLVLPRDACYVPAAWTIRVRVESSNAGDSSITTTTYWRDESAVNAYQIDFSTSAAENVASVFNGTGHTDGVTMAAERLLLSNDDASNAALEIVNANAGGTAMKTNGGASGQRNIGGTSGQRNIGGDSGQFNDGDNYGQYNIGATGSVQNDGPINHTVKNTGTLQDVDIAAVSGDTTAADNLELQYDGTGLTGDTFPATQLQGDTIETDIGALNDLDATEAEAAALAAITSYDASTGTEVASVASDIAALNDLSQAEAEVAVESATFSTAQFAAVALAADSLDATQLSKRQVNKVTLASTGTGTATQIVYDDDGTTPLTTQLVTDNGTTQTQGAAT